MPERVTIAVDPGTIDCGLAVLKGGEPAMVCRLYADGKQHLYRRMALILGQLSGVTNGLIDVRSEVELAFENPVFMERTRRRDLSRVAIPTRELQIFVGALVHWGIELDYQVIGYDVGDIKQWLTGSRSAAKDLVQASLNLGRKFWLSVGERDLSDHEWDALSVGVYHEAMRRVKEATIEGNPRA